MPRPRLHQILCTAFFKSKSRNFHQSCKEKSALMVKEGRYHMLFDGYPNLICKDDLNALSHRYIDILVEVNTNVDIVMEEKLLHKIRVLIADIAKLGAAELFNEYGRLSLSMLQVMGLKEYEDSLEGHEVKILTGYVKTVLQEVNHENFNSISNYENLSAILMKTIRIECPDVIISSISEPDLEINLHNWKAETINRVPILVKEHPVETALLLGTVGLFGASLIFGVKFIDSYANAAPMSRFEL